MRRFAAFVTLVLSVALVAPSSSTTVAAAPRRSPGDPRVPHRDRRGPPRRHRERQEGPPRPRPQGRGAAGLRERPALRGAGSFRLVESRGHDRAGEPPARSSRSRRAASSPRRSEECTGRGPASAVQPRDARLRPDEPRGQPPRREGRARLRREGHATARTQAAVFAIGTGLVLAQPFTSRQGSPPGRPIARGHLGDRPEGPVAHDPGSAGARRTSRWPATCPRAGRSRGADVTQPSVRAIAATPSAAAGDVPQDTFEVQTPGLDRPRRCAWRTASSARWRASGPSTRSSRW